jgi:hypothetical protein
MLNPVVTEIICAIKIMPIVYIKPASPTTQPKRIYIITPKIVNKDGVNTPANAPYFLISDILDFSLCVNILLFKDFAKLKLTIC